MGANAVSDLPQGFVLDAAPKPARATAPPEGFVLDTSELKDGLTDTAARWATFGLSDLAGAAGGATGAWLRGAPGTWGENYQKVREGERGKATNFAAEHPYANAGAAALGAVTPVAPVLKAAGEVAQAVPYGIGLLRQMGSGAATGAPIGAATALSSSESRDLLPPASDPLAPSVAKDTAIGALGGLVAGGAIPVAGALASHPLAWAARKMFPGSIDRQATGLISGRIGQDAAAGGLDANAIATRLSEAGNSPLSIADLGGTNTLALAGKFSRMQGEPREIADQFLGERMSGMAPRLVQSIDQNLSQGNAFQAAKDLVSQRRTDAAPLYEQAFAGGSIAPLETELTGAFNDAGRTASEAAARVNAAQQAVTNAQAKNATAGNVYSSSAALDAGREATTQLQQAQQELAAATQSRDQIAGVMRQAQQDSANGVKGGVWSPRVQEFLNDPIMKEGLARGLQVQRLEALAEGKSFNPREYAVTGFDQNGHPTVGQVPNMRLLDAGKRGLDEILNDYRDPLTGMLQRNQYVNAVDKVRQSYLGELDRLNPDYAAARQAWAGPTEALSAMRQGQNFRQMRPEQIGKSVSEMSPSEQEFFRLGAADALRTATGRTGTPSPLIGSNAVNQRGADYLQQQLRPLFKTQDAFDRFINDASNENLILANTGKLVGNSATAGRMAEDQAGHGGAVQAVSNLIGGGAALMAHEPVAGVGLFARGLAALNRAGEINNPKVNAAAARKIYSADPAQNAQTLATILAGRQSALPMVNAPAAGWAGSLYPRYELLPGEKPRQ